MDVPSAYFKFIIGKKAETKKRIENETKTQLRIPKQGEEGEIGKRSDLFPCPCSFFLCTPYIQSFGIPKSNRKICDEYTLVSL